MPAEVFHLSKLSILTPLFQLSISWIKKIDRRTSVIISVLENKSNLNLVKAPPKTSCVFHNHANKFLGIPERKFHLL